MSEISGAVPPYEPGRDALAAAGKAALSMIPVVGPVASESLSYALARRQDERQHEFNLLIADEITRLREGLAAKPALSEFVASDAFIAAVSWGQRSASETESERHRRRLAAAVVSASGWTQFASTEREQFKDLTERLGDLEVFLLHFFMDPRKWLADHGVDVAQPANLPGSVISMLEAVFDELPEKWQAPVSQAASRLKTEGLVDIPLSVMMTSSGVLSPRTSERGKRFLEFIGENESERVDAPSNW